MAMTYDKVRCFYLSGRLNISHMPKGKENRVLITEEFTVHLGKAELTKEGEFD